jgi:hypothetical protein
MQFVAVVDEDGDEHVLVAEMTTDPNLAEAVRKVKQVLRDQGLKQLAGD